jgi:hypothetical protein
MARRSMGFEHSPVPGYYLGISPSDSLRAAPVVQKPTVARTPYVQE